MFDTLNTFSFSHSDETLIAFDDIYGSRGLGFNCNFDVMNLKCVYRELDRIHNVYKTKPLLSMEDDYVIKALYNLHLLIDGIVCLYRQKKSDVKHPNFTNVLNEFKETEIYNRIKKEHKIASMYFDIICNSKVLRPTYFFTIAPLKPTLDNLFYLPIVTSVSCSNCYDHYIANITYRYISEYHTGKEAFINIKEMFSKSSELNDKLYKEYPHFDEFSSLLQSVMRCNIGNYCSRFLFKIFKAFVTFIEKRVLFIHNVEQLQKDKTKPLTVENLLTLEDLNNLCYDEVIINSDLQRLFDD